MFSVISNHCTEAHKSGSQDKKPNKKHNLLLPDPCCFWHTETRDFPTNDTMGDCGWGNVSLVTLPTSSPLFQGMPRDPRRLMNRMDMGFWFLEKKPCFLGIACPGPTGKVEVGKQVQTIPLFVYLSTCLYTHTSIQSLSLSYIHSHTHTAKSLEPVLPSGVRTPCAVMSWEQSTSEGLSHVCWGGLGVAERPVSFLWTANSAGGTQSSTHSCPYSGRIDRTLIRTPCIL